jgi:protein-disulfide isomerase/uncharacterized membrane protein
MKLTHRLMIVLVLCVAGAVLAGSLLMQHHGESSAVASQLCGESDTGCDKVNQSAYANVFGVPWAAVGLTFYLAIMAGLILALAAPGDAREPVAAALFALFAAGILIDLYLFGVQAFRIHAYCKLCLATYAVNIAAVAVLWPLRRAIARASALLAPPARVVLAGWLLAAVFVAAGVAMAESVLNVREGQRAANILGDKTAAKEADATPEPAASAAPTPELPTSGATSPDLQRYQQQLKAAQDEVKRLQTTLDDPQKYEVYQSQKSLSDFAKNPEVNVDVAGTPHKGPADAPIKIVEYSDFLCPFCRQIAQAFNGYVPHTANRVAIYYKFYPLDDVCNPAFSPGIHPGACWLAYGGVCAQQQGKFWPYHDKVFGLPPQKTPPDRPFVVKLAGELGMNESSFDACIGAPSTKERVTADVAEGTKAGVKGTPTIFINKRRLPRTNEFLAAVEQESKRLGLGPMPAVP